MPVIAVCSARLGMHKLNKLSCTLQEVSAIYEVAPARTWAPDLISHLSLVPRPEKTHVAGNGVPWIYYRQPAGKRAR